MHQNFIVNYYNRVVHQLNNLIWRSGQAQHLVERFGRAQQGSKSVATQLEFGMLVAPNVFLCNSPYMIFGPYLLYSF